jgi:hypothetical protein
MGVAAAAGGSGAVRARDFLAMGNPLTLVPELRPTFQ